MKKRIEIIRQVIAETNSLLKDFPEMRRFEAFKRALAKVKFLEEQQYPSNGNKVSNLIGTHNPKDWTY